MHQGGGLLADTCQCPVPHPPSTSRWLGSGDPLPSCCGSGKVVSDTLCKQVLTAPVETLISANWSWYGPLMFARRAGDVQCWVCTFALLLICIGKPITMLRIMSQVVSTLDQ